MFAVSQAYINKLLSIGAKRRYVRGTFNNIAFDEDDIIVKTLKYTKQAVSGSDIKLGGVFLGQLSLVFSKTFSSNVARNEWDKAEISLEIGLEIDPDEDPEFVPIGIYRVYEADYTAQGVRITAYDDMYAFDRDLNLSTTSGSLYALANYCCSKCHVELGMTREEFEALPNGDEVTSVYPDNDMTTFRDFVSWIGASMCCFATMDRYNRLVFKTWETEPCFTLGVDDRYEGGSFSAFVTTYTGVSFGNIAEQTTTYIHVVPDDGLTMNVGFNPLMQYGLEETKRRMRTAILDALQNFSYTPFKVSAFADPCFDLGDVITFTGGLAGTSIKSCIMRMDFQYAGGMTMQGFGRNPSLFGAQSKTDKDLSGLMAKGEESVIQYMKYANVEEMTIEQGFDSGDYDDSVKVLFNTFTIDTVKETNVDVSVRMICDEFNTAYNADNSAQNVHASFWGVVYEVDGEVVKTVLNPSYFGTAQLAHGHSFDKIFNGSSSSVPDLGKYQPLITFEDKQTLMNLPASSRKTLNVYGLFFDRAELKTGETSTKGKYHFPIEGIEIIVSGQGLSREMRWDGYIYVSDSVSRVVIEGMRYCEIDESLIIRSYTPSQPVLTDEAETMIIEDVSIVDIEEDFNLTMARPTFNTVDETGEYNLVSEDGLYNLTTE